MTTCSQAVIRKLHTLDQVRALTPGTVLKLNGRRSLYRTMASRDPNTIQARAFGSHVFDVDESCLPAVIVHVSAMDDTPVPDADQNERDQNTARTARLIKESL